MTPILTSSSLTTTLMSVNLAIIILIILLLCGVAGFTMWAVQLPSLLDRSYEALTPPEEANWSPFDENGYIDHARLKRQGFHEIGAIREDGFIGSGSITITPPYTSPETIIVAVCQCCGKTLRPEPGKTVIHHDCPAR